MLYYMYSECHGYSLETDVWQFYAYMCYFSGRENSVDSYWKDWIEYATEKNDMWSLGRPPIKIILQE